MVYILFSSSFHNFRMIYKKFIVSLCQSRNKGPMQLLLLICKFHSLSYDSASVSVRDSSCVTQSRRIANPGNCLRTICAKKNSFSSKTRQRRAVIEKQQGTVQHWSLQTLSLQFNKPQKTLMVFLFFSSQRKWSFFSLSASSISVLSTFGKSLFS